MVKVFKVSCISGGQSIKCVNFPIHTAFKVYSSTTCPALLTENRESIPINKNFRKLFIYPCLALNDTEIKNR
jgi:hypothetical protein